MKLPQTSTSNNPLKRVWIALWGLTHVRFKRMCLLSSLHARLSHCSEDECEKLQALNVELKLTRDYKAMKFPTLLAPYIWKRIMPIEKIDMSRPEAYVKRLLHSTPCWLIYSDEETLKKDFRDLLDFCNREVCTL